MGERGTEVGEGGSGYGGGGSEWEIIYLSLHCHHQNDSCIKMGSDGSHFNVSFMVRDKITRQCPQTTTFPNRKESRSGIEPRSFCLPRAIVSWCTGPNQPHRAATGNVKTCVERSTLLLFYLFLNSLYTVHCHKNCCFLFLFFNSLYTVQCQKTKTKTPLFNSAYLSIFSF